MKFLYQQDGHFKGKNPGGRLDNYSESWLIKFQEYLDLGDEYEVDAYLDGGDLFDIPNISNIFLDRIIDMIEEKGKPYYALYGNHCQIGQNIGTSQGTSLAHTFRRSKLIQPMWALVKPKNYCIGGFDYYFGIEEDIKKEGINFKNTGWKIAIVHAFITPKPFLPEVSHIVYDEIKTNADLVLVAHYHEQWEKEHEGTTFLDIGNLGRCARSEYKIKPSCLFINTDKREWKQIELKSAKPGNEIFDLEKIKEEKEFDKNINNFISSLQSTKVQSLNIKDRIKEVCKKQKIEKEVQDLIMENIE